MVSGSAWYLKPFSRSMMLPTLPLLNFLKTCLTWLLRTTQMSVLHSFAQARLTISRPRVNGTRWYGMTFGITFAQTIYQKCTSCTENTDDAQCGRVLGVVMSVNDTKTFEKHAPLPNHLS